MQRQGDLVTWEWVTIAASSTLHPTTKQGIITLRGGSRVGVFGSRLNHDLSDWAWRWR